jgi:outer membrane protein TolC
MNKTFLTILLLGVTSLNAWSLTLKESFDSARLNMESIKRAESQVEVFENQKDRARGVVLPNVSAVGTWTRIDPPSGAGASPFLLTQQNNYALRLTQPLLRGGSVSAYQLAKENILLAQFQKDATELNLYQLVINAYFNLAIAQVDIKNVEELLKFSRERVGEIRERTNIGKSRRGELVEAEAQLMTAESQYQQSLITLKQHEKTFEFYTRLQPTEIGALPELPLVTGSVQEYMMKVKMRADVRAIQQQTIVADKQISIARGGHVPQLDFITNYYIDRTGVLASSKWDVGFAVVIPLFQGGTVQAQVREAVAQKRIAELNSAESVRAAERDISINYQNLQQLQLQLKSLKEAMSKAEQAYKLNKKDYTYGLVTNLDVLQSLNVYIETKRSYNSLFSLAHLNHKSLEAATGVLP